MSVSATAPARKRSQNRVNPLTIWDVPPDLKARFKSRCIKNGMTMRDAVLRFLKDYSRP